MKRLLNKTKNLTLWLYLAGLIVLVTSSCQIVPSLNPTQAPTVMSTPTFTPIPLLPTTIVVPTNMPIPSQDKSKERPFQAMEPVLSRGILGIDLSPKVAEFMYIDTLGKRIGYDPISGKIVNDLVDQENARSYNYEDVTESGVGIYITSAEEDKNELLMFSPLYGEATIAITGASDGEYKLRKIFQGGAAGDVGIIEIITGTITAGEVQILKIQIP